MIQVDECGSFLHMHVQQVNLHCFPFWNVLKHWWLFFFLIWSRFIITCTCICDLWTWWLSNITIDGEFVGRSCLLSFLMLYLLQWRLGHFISTYYYMYLHGLDCFFFVQYIVIDCPRGIWNFANPVVHVHVHHREGKDIHHDPIEPSVPMGRRGISNGIPSSPLLQLSVPSLIPMGCINREGHPMEFECN